jgi:beta-glucosidase-like glycosyl hydrolase
MIRTERSSLSLGSRRTPGEDPMLSGQYAINFVKGMQENPLDPGHIMASACCKHFVANSMEKSRVDGVEWKRHNFDAIVSDQDLADSYLPAFQSCVEEGRVSGLMCSYNALNGVPTCADPWLLQTVARDAWEFDGYVTSDW